MLERSTGLRQYAELGVALDALVSADLLTSVFLPYSPLHDGAVFIQGGRVVAAGCFLPLSRNTQIGRALGTRHRAALGIAEETDAIALVVSEETGRLSLACAGRIEAVDDADALRRSPERADGRRAATARARARPARCGACGGAARGRAEPRRPGRPGPLADRCCAPSSATGSSSSCRWPLAVGLWLFVATAPSRARSRSRSRSSTSAWKGSLTVLTAPGARRVDVQVQAARWAAERP